MFRSTCIHSQFSMYTGRCSLTHHEWNRHVPTHTPHRRHWSHRLPWRPHPARRFTREPVTLIAAARDASRLPAWFAGETRIGDLTDPAYRREVVRGRRRRDPRRHVVQLLGPRARGARTLRGARPRPDRPGRRRRGRALHRGQHRRARHPVHEGEALVRRRLARSRPLILAAPRGDGARRGPHARRRQARRTQMVSLRLGHFIGAGNSLGLVSALIPRLKTRQVPWVNHGRAHLPLVSGAGHGARLRPGGDSRRRRDSGRSRQSTSSAASSPPLARSSPTSPPSPACPSPPIRCPCAPRTALARSWRRSIHSLPGRAPFLTRSLVFVGENWHMDDAKARRVLGIHAAPTTGATWSRPRSTNGAPWATPGRRSRRHSTTGRGLEALASFYRRASDSMSSSELRDHLCGHGRAGGAHRLQVVGRGGACARRPTLATRRLER